MAEEKFSPDHKTDDAIDESNPLAIIQVNPLYSFFRFNNICIV